VSGTGPRLIEATIDPETGERRVYFATERGVHTFTIKDAAEDVWQALQLPKEDSMDGLCENGCDADIAVRVKLPHGAKGVCEPCAQEGGDPELLDATEITFDAARSRTEKAEHGACFAGGGPVQLPKGMDDDEFGELRERIAWPEEEV